MTSLVVQTDVINEGTIQAPVQNMNTSERWGLSLQVSLLALVLVRWFWADTSHSRVPFDSWQIVFSILL